MSVHRINGVVILEIPNKNASFLPVYLLNSFLQIFRLLFSFTNCCNKGKVSSSELSSITVVLTDRFSNFGRLDRTLVYSFLTQISIVTSLMSICGRV